MGSWLYLLRVLLLIVYPPPDLDNASVGICIWIFVQGENNEI